MNIVEISSGLLVDLEQIRHYVKLKFKNNFKEFGLNYNLYLILFYIRFFPNKTQYDISKELHINKSGINKYIKKLEDLAYVKLKTNTKGKVIIKNIELTQNAFEALDTIVEQMFLIENKRNLNLEESIILLINKKLNGIDESNLSFKSEDGLLITIERFLNFIYTYLNSFLENEGLNNSHYLLLNYLKKSNTKVLQKELMNAFNLTKQNMNFLVKYLIEEGLVNDYFEKESNRKVKKLEISKEGLYRLNKIYKKSNIIFGKFFLVEDIVDLKVITNLISLLSQDLNIKY